MPSAIDAILAVVFSILFFLGTSCLAILLISRQSPCEGCEYYLNSKYNQCLFNPLSGEPVPKQCTREAWDI